MSKIVIIDNEGVGCAFAYRCAEYGHTVKYFIEQGDDVNQSIGKGMHENIERVREWLPHCYGADLVITMDNAKYLKKLEMLRSRGIAVVAPSQAVADLEIKRGLGLQFLQEHGIEVPEYEVFKTLKEAEKHVLDNPQQYVFKTLGDNEDKALTFVGKSPEQLIQQLRDWQKDGVAIKGDVMLQKFVKGQEFAVARWVGKTSYIGPIKESFEHKKLYAGEKGQNTGEMGTVSKYVNSSKLYDMVMAPLEKSLVEMGAFTNVDVNCIIDDDGKVWPLEFTCRLGWPQFNLELYAHKGDPAQWMIDMCAGADTLRTSMDTIVGVCLVTQGFPVTNEDRGTAIYGLTPIIKKYVQPQFIKMGKFIDDIDGTGNLMEVEDWVCAGTYNAVVCAGGETVTEAQERVYEVIDKISISNLGYRIDIGDKVKESLPILKKLGFASKWRI